MYNIKMVFISLMVPEILNSIDRPNPTRWFRLNQWSNRAHIAAPVSQKPKFCNNEKKFEIAWDMYDFWGPKAKSAPDLKNEKFWKLLGCTKYVQYRCDKLKSVYWMKIEAFINYQMSNSGKLNLFPPIKIIEINETQWLSHADPIWIHFSILNFA